MGHWYLPQVEGICPAPRGGAACVAVGNQVLMFGGADRVPQVFDDLWLLETGGGSFEWTRIAANISPTTELTARCGAALTAVHDKIYLMGGQDPVNGTVFNDLIVLDTKSWEWSEVEVRGGRPPSRHSHCMGLLQDNCLLVFGGAAPRGTLGDVWIFNIDQRVWTRPTVSGYVPPAREMHTGVMVDSATMLVFGGRGEDGRILCDAAVFDARSMSWVAQEPTPFARCAHSAVLMPTADATERRVGDTDAAQSIIMYGGFSGEAVEGDVLRIDPSTLEVEIVSKGPRPSVANGTMPAPRFAHTAVSIPVPAPDADESSMAMLVFGGVNPTEDLADIAIWTIRASNVPSAAPVVAAPPTPVPQTSGAEGRAILALALEQALEHSEPTIKAEVVEPEPPQEPKPAVDVSSEPETKDDTASPSPFPTPPTESMETDAA